MNCDYIKYIDMINSIASKFYGVEREDLIQAGFLGLIKAKKNYKSNNSVKFTTYAYNYIYGEMYEIAISNKPIKIRKELLKFYKRVITAKELLTQKYKKEITYEETCKYLNLDYLTFVNILNALSKNLDLDKCEIKYSNKEKIDNLILLRESLEKLTKKERNVIEKRFVEDKTQKEVAKILGLSQVKVSRIEKNGKLKIKRFINS